MNTPPLKNKIAWLLNHLLHDPKQAATVDSVDLWSKWEEDKYNLFKVELYSGGYLFRAWDFSIILATVPMRQILTEIPVTCAFHTFHRRQNLVSVQGKR